MGDTKSRTGFSTGVTVGDLREQAVLDLRRYFKTFSVTFRKVSTREATGPTFADEFSPWWTSLPS